VIDVAASPANRRGALADGARECLQLSERAKASHEQRGRCPEQSKKSMIR
jgi:hypothetical protein